MKALGILICGSLGFTCFSIFGEDLKPALNRSEATPKVDQGQWQTRSFRVANPAFFDALSESGQVQILSLPELPPQDADKTAWVDHIKKSTEAIRPLFEKDGFKFPPGTAFAVDSKSGTIAVRTSREPMDLVENDADLSLHSIRQYLVLRLDVIQAEGSVLRQLIKESHLHADMTKEWRSLKDLVDQGKARLLETARLETNSGQRASIDTGARIEHPVSLNLDAQGRTEWGRKTRNAGLHLEVDPIIGPDRWTVDLSFDLEYHYAPPTIRMAYAGEAGPLGRIEIPVTDFHRAETATAMSFGNGMTRLISVWTPDDTVAVEKSDILQAAFLHVDLERNVPAKNETLAAMLEKYAEQAVPTPSAPDVQHPPAAGLPNGMHMRAFKVPRDFLASGGEPRNSTSPPVDPFATRPDDNRPLHPRCRLAREILQDAGITFPEGSEAIFNASMASLMVINTQENLDAVEAYVGCGCHLQPSNLVLTLQIVEADGSTMRKIIEDAAPSADCGETLRQLEVLASQRKATFKGILSTETRSGQRMKIESGTERMKVERFHKTNTAGEMTATLEGEAGGTQMEIDPIFGPDGITVDLSISAKHQLAPPSDAKQGGSSDGGTWKVEFSSTDTHEASFLLATTFQAGTTHLISFWKAEGNKDVMQAAFLSVDIVKIDGDPAPVK